jgi:hypothetical protein
MYHLGVMVKSWRQLMRNSRKQQSETGGPVTTVELEWRKGQLNNNTFEPGLVATDFQTLAKRLMNMYQLANPTNPPLSTNISTSTSSTSSTSSTPPPPISAPLGVQSLAPMEVKGDAVMAAKPVSSLGRIVKVQEWHLEDVQYEGGLRARQSKLVSSLPAQPSPLTAGSAESVGATVSEYVRKQRVMWSDMRVLQRKYDGRFSLGCECPVPSTAMANLSPEQRRMQTRRAFWVENYLRIDLSIVQQQQLSSSNTQHPHPPTIRYEAEMELLPEGAQVLSDAQLVSHLWNWILEIEDSFGKINGSETVDGPLWIVRLSPTVTSTVTSTGTSNDNVQKPATDKAICTDVLLVPISRDVSRSNHTF